MPPREISRSAGRKHESGEYSPFLTDLSSWVDDAFSELVWENGRVTVKSQGFVSRGSVSGARGDAPKPEKLIDVDSFLPDNSLVLPSVEFDLCESDEMDPWFGYPFMDASEQHFSPELLPKGVKNGLPEQSKDVVNSARNGKMENQNKGFPTATSSAKSTNFRCFSRYSSDLHTPGEITASDSVEKREAKGKYSAADGCNSFNKGSDFHAQLVSNSEQGLERKENDKLPSCSGNLAKERTPVEACSVSCNQTDNCKEKTSDAEESASHSDVKRCASPQRGSRSKRRRVPEVHNLSERKRRDRINEKMKALQELIPNSNKTDKASMLDQAAQYLKMLQHQLQMMYMGAGMCMPQMMFPAGMYHPPPHFPQMGVGVGLGKPDNRFSFPPGVPMQVPSGYFRVRDSNAGQAGADSQPCSSMVFNPVNPGAKNAGPPQ